MSSLGVYSAPHTALNKARQDAKKCGPYSFIFDKQTNLYFRKRFKMHEKLAIYEAICHKVYRK